MFRRRHPVSDEQLSALLDDQLAAKERTRVVAHVEACEACRAAFAELRAVRGALQTLPLAVAPRSFALRDADVRPEAAPASPLTRAMPLLSGVTVAAMVAFVVLVGIDAGGQTLQDESATLQSADSDTQAEEAPAADGELLSDGDQPRDGKVDEAAEDASGEGAAGFDEFGGNAEDDAASPNAQGLRPPAAEATRSSAPADTTSGENPTPTEEQPQFDVEEPDDGPEALLVAEVAAAGVALAGGASLAFVWWRRRT